MFQKNFLDLRICWKELEFNNGTRSFFEIFGSNLFFFILFFLRLSQVFK